MSRRESPRLRSEDGAIAVIAALTLTLLLLFSAFVIDLGGLRADTALNQSVSDMAAGAAAQEYSATEVDSAYRACLTAVAYAEANLDLSFGAGAPSCAVFQTGAVCNASGPSRTAVYTSAEYTLRVTNPVFDDHPSMLGVLYEDFDGEPCDRLAVEVLRSRDYFLAGAVGLGDSGTTGRSAVVRGQGLGDAGQFASLIILQKNVPSDNCPTLMKQGNGQITVKGAEVDGVNYPGIITIDTETPAVTACDDKLIDFIGVGGGAGEIRAVNADGSPGHIYSHALFLDDSDPDVYDSNANLSPDPDPGPNVTRAPVDFRFNCLDSYPTDELWSPNHPNSVSVLTTCGEEDEETYEGQPYIRDLHDELSDLKLSEVAGEPGWGIIGDGAGPGGPACNEVGDLSGKDFWFVDCDSFEPADLSITGASLIVTRGGIDVGTSKGNAFEVSSDDGTILWVQDGDLTATTGNEEIDFRNTFVYLENGVSRTGANSDVVWRAPLEATSTCSTLSMLEVEDVTVTVPSAGCLAPLALWTNSLGEHSMGGGGDMNIAGSFFTPNAQPFVLQGNPKQALDEAQFFSARFEAAGTGNLTMRPNPNTNIDIPLTGGGFIR